MKLYSLFRVIDGKWEVVLHIRRNDDWKFQYEPRPELRALIEENYDVTPDVLAKILLESVLHCEAVEIHQMSGQGIVMRRCNDQTSE
jgi:hypothetical protein